MNKAFLILRGTFTQKQFDAIGQIWDRLQRNEMQDWTLPCIQIPNNSNIGLIRLEDTGEISLETLFEDKDKDNG